MKKTFFILSALLVLAWGMISCNGNSPVKPQPVEDFTMYVGEQVEMPAQFAPWSSTKPFVAEVQSEKLLLAKHVGKCTLHSRDTSCMVTVEPKYTYAPYDEPLLMWGLTKNELKSLLGKPDEAETDFYAYYSSDKMVVYEYLFDSGDPQVLYGVDIIFEKENTRISAEKVIAMLEERYCLVLTQSDEYFTTSVYADCTQEEYEKNPHNARIQATLKLGWVQVLEYRKM